LFQKGSKRRKCIFYQRRIIRELQLSRKSKQSDHRRRRTFSRGILSHARISIVIHPDFDLRRTTIRTV